MIKSDLKIRTKNYALSVIRLFAALPKRTETQMYVKFCKKTITADAI
jgi:hypothetical protein